MPNRPNDGSSSDPDEDRASMAALCADEPAALDRIILRHGPTLHAYLLRVLQNAEDAREVALDTFVRVHAHRDRFDPRRTFATWLYTIATNLARDRLRWRQRHPEVPLDPTPTDHPGTHPNHPPGPSLPDPASGPVETLVHAERATAVRNAVARLPEDLRVPLLLSEFENQPTAEIASILGCSPKAVEMRLYRARQILRKTLAPWIQD